MKWLRVSHTNRRKKCGVMSGKKKKTILLVILLLKLFSRDVYATELNEIATGDEANVVIHTDFLKSEVTNPSIYLNYTAVPSICEQSLIHGNRWRNRNRPIPSIRSEDP